MQQQQFISKFNQLKH